MTTADPPAAARYRAPALEKGLEILEVLARVPTPMTMSEISVTVGRSKGEIFRMLQVLEEHGYIARGAGDGYRLTNRLFALAMEQPPIRGLIDTALPEMHALAERAGQSCHLAVASGGQMVVVARVEAPGFLGFAVRIGHRRALPITVSGLTLLAFQTPAVRAAMLDAAEAEGCVFDRTTLSPRLDAGRTAGQFRVQSRMSKGITDVSAPILVRNAAQAALTVPFLAGEPERVGIDAAADALMDTVRSISTALTFGSEPG